MKIPQIPAMEGMTPLGVKPMSNEEFRDHIKAICGPAPVADKPCVRVPTNRGYYPTPKEAA